MSVEQKWAELMERLASTSANEVLNEKKEDKSQVKCKCCDGTGFMSKDKECEVEDEKGED